MTHNIQANDLVRTVYDNASRVLKVNDKSVRVQTASGFKVAIPLSQIHTLNQSRFV